MPLRNAEQSDRVPSPVDVEQRTREIAEALYPVLQHEKPSFFASSGWKKSVLDWSLRDEQFRAQLLRFIDVLPALNNNALCIRVFQEYLNEAKHTTSLLLRSAEIFSRNFPAAVAAPLIRSSVRSLSKEFITGSEPAEALPAIQAFLKQGTLVSIDLLGEAAVSEIEAGAYVQRYLGLLDILDIRTPEKPHAEGSRSPFDVSFKISSFFSRIDPLNFDGSVENITRALRPIVEKAARLGVSFTFDMEQYYYKNLVIAAFKRILSEYGGRVEGSIALQTYLKDTRDDLLHLITWAEQQRLRIGIRLVKGAYWDYEVVTAKQKGWPVPVLLSKSETDANYEDLTAVLLEHADAVRPAIATHNIRSVAHALAYANSRSLDPEALEFQFLFGMGGPLAGVIRQAGFANPIRIYCPVGELLPGIAYLVRRVLENTSNESFLRKTFSEDSPLEALIRRPIAANPPEAKHSDEFTNEPPTDFSKEENRGAVKRALDRVRGTFGKRYPLVLDGSEIATAHESLSTNPANPAETIGRISQATPEDADKAVEAAKTAGRFWRRISPEQRAEYLLRAAAEMRNRRFDLIALEAYEVGKTISEADADVAEAVDHCAYNARRMKELAGPRRLGRVPGEINEYSYEPKGTAVIIPPWNFPLAIPAGMTSAALVAGNCAILKPSGLSPVIAWQLVDIFRAAGLPRGVLQYLPGPGSGVGEYLVQHPGVDLIAFTGSKDVGLRIVQLAGVTRPGQRGVKRVVAEMGGKNAVIVDQTADLDEAVRGVLESAFGYQGQKCSACSRVIVLAEVFELFSRRLAEAAESIEIGPPEKPGTFLGPLIDRSAFEKVRRSVELGKQEATPVLIRDVPQKAGYFTGPAIFDVSPGAVIATEEIFGPVLSLIRAKDFAEAIAIANESEYALTGGLYSRSPSNIRQAKQEFLVGNLYINRKITGALVGRQPFGGFGMSGIGSQAGGPDYLLQFMNPRTVSEHTMRKGSASGEEKM
ncbi:MAG TPA: L-glutamate gamma-semialdehyde dehydrogenase [Nitrospirota bacterium]|nr:L-glutamate gamma-semialdehyde dehydrogenase [Nitrospirota bacterium]